VDLNLSNAFVAASLPRGAVILYLAKQYERAQHFCTLIDGVVHDTWNPEDDENYMVKAYWTPPRGQNGSTLPVAGPKRRVSREQELTQQE
jgi:hypothetical protein